MTTTTAPRLSAGGVRVSSNAHADGPELLVSDHEHAGTPRSVPGSDAALLHAVGSA